MFPLPFYAKLWKSETKNKVLKTVNDKLFIIKKILRGGTIVGQQKRNIYHELFAFLDSNPPQTP